MKICFLFSAVLVLTGFNLQAQFEVKGKITDRKELIEGAAIYMKNQRIGSTTQANGVFVLSSEFVIDTLLVRSLV